MTYRLNMIFETPFYKDGEEGINVQYKITSFDTLALVKQLQLGNLIFKDESKISSRDSFNLETKKFVLIKMALLIFLIHL